MRKSVIPVLLGLCIVLVSCGTGDPPLDDGTDDTEDTTEESVYPAKTYVVGQGASNDPVVWNNKTVTSLEIPSGMTGCAYGVAIVGDVVYVCGSYSDGMLSYPCVWKDGLRTDLPIEQTGVWNFANAIAASSSTIYVAGQAYITAAGYFLPGYWEWNGSAWTWTSLSTDIVGTALAVTIDGSGYPWFAGYKGSTNFACYWDSSKTHNPLSAAGSTASLANGIAVGASTIVTGYYMNTTKYPCYWIDGTCTEITTPAVPDSIDAVAISGTDVYIVGTCTESIYPVPGYWKNGTWNPLSVGEHGLNHASAIVVSNSIVYVAGQYTNDAGTTLGCFWAGDERIDVMGVLPVYGIAVKE